MYGRTVEEAALIHMAERLSDCRAMVGSQYRERCEERARACRWLSLKTGAEVYQDQGGQFAFAF